MRKPIVLILIGHYLPGFRMGGPLRSIVNLVERLHPEFDFRILTSERDLGEKASYPGIPQDTWVPVGPALVRYMSLPNQTLRGIACAINSINFDILYLNGFFSPRFTVFPLVARKLGMIHNGPTIIATRGEFSTGALALKPLKKRLYLSVAKPIGLFKSILWQASSEVEAQDIRAVLGPCGHDVRIAMNLSPPAKASLEPHPAVPPLGEQLKIAFVGRISPMKNLDYALRVLANVRVPVSFSIFGPLEDEAYAATCRKLEKTLPPQVTVCWHGHVEPARVPGVVGCHDLFFLPTRGENFGHVIAEALSAGTPVLISDATPWRGLLKLGVGHDLSLSDPSSFAAAIEEAARKMPDERAAQRAQCRAYMHERNSSGADVEAHRQLFAAALKRAKANG